MAKVDGLELAQNSRHNRYEMLRRSKCTSNKHVSDAAGELCDVDVCVPSWSDGGRREKRERGKERLILIAMGIYI